MNLFSSDHPAQSIENELSKVTNWLHANKMKINISKTKVLHYSAHRKVINPPQLHLNNELIERVEYFNYLRITIDQNLTWKIHTQNLSRKIAKAVGVLCRLNNFLPSYVLKTIHSSLLACHLNYGILLWGGKIDQIFKLQKKAVRVITNSPPFSHTDPIFIDLNLLKVQDIYILNQFKFAHKLFNSKLPPYFLDNFVSLNAVHHLHNTRGRLVTLSTPRFWHGYY